MTNKHIPKPPNSHPWKRGALKSAEKYAITKDSASRSAKSAGLKSLAQVSNMTGVSAQTLNNWFSDKPDLFKIVIKGCAEINKED